MTGDDDENRYPDTRPPRLAATGASLARPRGGPARQAPLAQAQQARQQLEQALNDHLSVLREAELALSCVLTLLLRHDEEMFAGKQLRVLLEPFQQQMEVALHGLEGLR